MGTDPQAEFLAQIARHKELIETSVSNRALDALVKQVVDSFVCVTMAEKRITTRR